MADGKWVLKDEDKDRVDLTFSGSREKRLGELPNFGQCRYVDDRRGDALRKCAFCGSEELQLGFGGYGDGFGYKSGKCSICGGTTNFVYKDEKGKFI